MRALVADLRDATQAKAQAGGWNGIFLDWTPVSYSTQVVAGTNYFVKIKVSGDKCVHVRIFKPLGGGAPEVVAVQTDKTIDDPVEHFS